MFPALALVTCLAAGAPPTASSGSPKPLSTSALLEQSNPSDWRPLDPADTLYLELPKGRVIIELAAAFAPRHARNLRTLAHEGYFDGLAILRSQDDYVVQWGDPDGDDPKKAKPLGGAERKLPAEITRSSDGLPFARLPDPDTYAPQVGFSSGFPVGLDPTGRRAWLTHCYGMVGAARDTPIDSSNGSELYVVIGHSPRHLDRNITVVGRVVSGMELLSTLPRGTGALGFYEKPAERTPLLTVRLAADLPPAQRSPLEVLRTDTALFQKYVDARRFRRDEWFADPVGHLEVCNVGIPVRVPPQSRPAAPTSTAR